MSAPTLHTERLRLRPFASGDVDLLHAHWTDPDVRRWLWDGNVIAREQAVAIVEESIDSFERRRFGFWVIEADAAFVGFTGLRAIPDAADIELYYGLERAHWGHGYATEASRTVLRYGFDVAGLDPIYIRTDGPNLASVEVMKRLGAEYVRTDPIGAFGSTIVYVMRRGAPARLRLPPDRGWATPSSYTLPAREESPWSTRWSSTAARSRPASGTTSSIPPRASRSRSARAALRRTSRTPCRRPLARSRPGGPTRRFAARN
jgi:RimJ/RimL family protein N-acetyltransferase